MMGTPKDKGIIPRLCEMLFEEIAQNSSETHKFKVEVSYMEIYNERVCLHRDCVTLHVQISF